MADLTTTIRGVFEGYTVDVLNDDSVIFTRKFVDGEVVQMRFTRKGLQIFLQMLEVLDSDNSPAIEGQMRVIEFKETEGANG